jgi:hypothetical protein
MFNQCIQTQENAAMRRIAITAEQLAELAQVAQYGRRPGYGGGGLSATDLAQEARRRFGLAAVPSASTVTRWLRGYGLTYAGDRWRDLPAG